MRTYETYMESCCCSITCAPGACLLLVSFKHRCGYAHTSWASSPRCANAQCACCKCQPSSCAAARVSGGQAVPQPRSAPPHRIDDPGGTGTTSPNVPPPSQGSDALRLRHHPHPRGAGEAAGLGQDGDGGGGGAAAADSGGSRSSSSSSSSGKSVSPGVSCWRMAATQVALGRWGQLGCGSHARGLGAVGATGCSGWEPSAASQVAR